MEIEKVIIIGSGPAGSTAAIYAARAELNPLVIAGSAYGGQLMLTTEVENYPGFKTGIVGPELMSNMISQAERFGARFIYNDVTKVELLTSTTNSPAIQKVWIRDKEYQTYSLIIATGAKPRKLEITGEIELWGRGVSSCATCDGAFYKNKVVVVVGGGDSAMEEAIFLTKFASKVYIIHRRSEFKASAIMVDRAKSNSKIEFILDTVVNEIIGTPIVKGDNDLRSYPKVQGVSLQNLLTNEKYELIVDGLFLAIGYIPETELFGNYIDIDKDGYAVPDKNTMSKIPGVFIAGDVEDKHYRQAITAAADGCKASLDLEKWLSENTNN